MSETYRCTACGCGYENPLQANDCCGNPGYYYTTLKDGKQDQVNHPSHYTSGKIETIDAIEDWGLCYHLSNVIKYVARCEHKGKKLEDLKKARWYLDRYVKILEGKND